jgi:hypothetical protein
MRTITLNQQQLRRAEIITQLIAGHISSQDAAHLLGVTLRHLRRLRARFATQHLDSIIHGNTGRAPANRTDPQLVARLLVLCGEGGKYHDFNISHLTDLLARDEAITVARSTLSLLLRRKGVRSPPRTKTETKRMRRERKHQEGMMLQIDGSPHDWLEGRAAAMSLVGAIDDATSKIIYASFRPSEDQAGYLVMLREIARTYGLPRLLYHDRHTILRSPKEPTLADELAGRRPQSQVQRVMQELGIKSIPALSPQAKGRIERLWRTLQDRLTKELRLADIRTLEAANEFLPSFITAYNARFALAAAQEQSAWMELPQAMDIEYQFSTREERKVRRDHTIAYQGETLQIVLRRDEPSLSTKWVEVHVTPEGSIYLYDEQRRLEHRVVSAVDRALLLRPPQQSSRPPKVKREADPQARVRRLRYLHAM